MNNRINIDALECTEQKAIKYIAVYTSKVPYVVTWFSHHRIPVSEVENIPNIAPLIYHLENAPEFTLSGQKLRDFADLDALLTLNMLVNNVAGTVPYRISLVWV